MDFIFDLAREFGWQATSVLMAGFAILQWMNSRLETAKAQRAEADTIQSMVKSLTTSHDDLAEKYKTVETDLARLAEEKHEDHVMILDLKRLVSELQDKIRNLEAVRDDLQTRYDGAILALSHAQTEANNQREMIADLRRDLDVARNELRLCQRRVSDFDLATEPVNPTQPKPLNKE
jgi:chromosome segregation ATPase